MNLRVLQKHSSTHWEIGVQKGDKTQVIHFHQGLGLMGLCTPSAVLEKIEVQSWYKIQSRVAEVQPEPGCIWMSFQMSHLAQEVADDVLYNLSINRRLPIDFFLIRNVPALPGYVEVSNWFQQTPQPTWKASELERMTSYRRDLLDGLYRSVIRVLEPVEERGPEMDFMREAPDDQLLARAQLLTHNQPLYQVRLQNNGWVSVLLTVDEEEARAKHLDFDELGSSGQFVTLKPDIRDQRVWKLVGFTGSLFYFKCQRTQAYGVLDGNRISPVDALYLCVNPEFKSDMDSAAIGMLWPTEHNHLIDLLCEEKSFTWGDEWQVQVVAGTSSYSTGRIQLKHYREVFPMAEVGEGLFKLPNQANVEGLTRALQKSGFFRRDAAGNVKLIDPELRLELGLSASGPV